MADSGLTLQIDEALADSLRARADAAGQSVEEYALLRLRDDATTLGGFEEDSEAYADELDRICDETLRTGGIPWEQFRHRLRNLRQASLSNDPDHRLKTGLGRHGPA